MAENSLKDTLVQPIVGNNPVIVQVLGICSALAVTSNMKTTVVMCIGLTIVTAVCNFFISLVQQSIELSTVTTCSTISCASRFLIKNLPVPQNVQPTGHPD